MNKDDAVHIMYQKLKNISLSRQHPLQPIRNSIIYLCEQYLHFGKGHIETNHKEYAKDFVFKYGDLIEAFYNIIVDSAWNKYIHTDFQEIIESIDIILEENSK